LRRHPRRVGRNRPYSQDSDSPCLPASKGPTSALSPDRSDSFRVFNNFFSGIPYLCRAWDIEVLKRIGERHRDMWPRNCRDWSLQVSERFLGYQRGDIRGHVATRMRLINDHEAPCFNDALKNRIFIQRAYGTGINDFRMDSFLGELISSLLRHMDHAGYGH